MKKLLLILLTLLAVVFVSCSRKVDDISDTNEPIQIDKDEKEETIKQPEKTEEVLDNPLEEEPITTEPEEIVETEPEEVITPENIGVEGIKLSTYNVSLYVGAKKMPIVTMLPQNATDKREIWTSSNSEIATVDAIGNIKGIAEGECTITVASANNPDVSATVSVTVLPEAELTYIDGILVVNKTYPLPSTYAPGWETESSGPLWEMIAAAKSEGIKLWMTSGYRSYYDQEYIYNGYVRRDGQEEADTYSARPGHSEHQTGLAYDLNDLDWNFGETKEGIWVAENCHKYGFILRYPEGKEEITGYKYEPWHIRYVGVEKATEIYESGLCLEEFLGITSAYGDNIVKTDTTASEEQLLSILENQTTFVSENGENIFLKDYIYGTDGTTTFYAQPQKYTLVDLDGDGCNEMVVDITPNQSLYMIFHKSNDNIYGFLFGIRSLNQIKEDGSFTQSSSAFITHYSNIVFEGENYKIINAAIRNTIDNIFEINGNECKVEEIDAYIEKWQQKKDVKWIEIS